VNCWFLTFRGEIGILLQLNASPGGLSQPFPCRAVDPVSELISVVVPTVGESISEVQVAKWLKAEGEWIAQGEDLVEIETEKASVQIPSPASGIVRGILKQSEEFAAVGDVIGSIEPSESSAPATSVPSAGQSPRSAANAEIADASPPSASFEKPKSAAAPPASAETSFVMPAAQRLLDEHGLQASQVPATGPGGRLLKEDVLAFVAARGSSSSASPKPASASKPASTSKPSANTTLAAPASERRSAPTSLISEGPAHRSEEVKPMSMLRRTIAARLVEAQQTAALLTTFNEIDMQSVMSIRKKYQDRFLERHGVKLGFMSFFAKASVEALRRFPAVNAMIRDDQIVYRHYQDIGIAIGGGKGLVVPILRNVERMSFGEIEVAISEFVKKAGENRIQADDLIGGTFTISNGGIYGSLLSTPIVNPPQSGILGLHAIQDRPVAIDGNVVIRPMMYIALTYDHRIVDGREAVGFLKTIKDVIEDPSRLFLEL
jgi:2-oxoglutarate dehydrogenase E2 component (dihydrolipoamide succinyltransferase)